MIILQQGGGAETNTNTHRFLVQGVHVQSSESVSREQWADFPKDQIQEGKLTVVLEEKETASVQSNAAETVKPSNNRPPVDGGSENGGELKTKYDELVQYTLMLEKEKKKLESDMAVVRSKQGGSAGDAGFNKFHLIFVAVLAFLLSHCTRYLER